MRSPALARRGSASAGSILHAQEHLLHDVHPGDVTAHVVVAAALSGQQAQAPPRVAFARAGAAQMDDSREILLLLSGRVFDPRGRESVRDVQVEIGRGQLDGIRRRRYRGSVRSGSWRESAPPWQRARRQT